MTSDEARRRVVSAAHAFGDGSTTIQEMRAALLNDLHDLSQDMPLSGDYLDLFNSLERWESSTGNERNDEEESALAIARRLGANA